MREPAIITGVLLAACIVAGGMAYVLKGTTGETVVALEDVPLPVASSVKPTDTDEGAAPSDLPEDDSINLLMAIDPDVLWLTHRDIATRWGHERGWQWTEGRTATNVRVPGVAIGTVGEGNRVKEVRVMAEFPYGISKEDQRFRLDGVVKIASEVAMSSAEETKQKVQDAVRSGPGVYIVIDGDPVAVLTVEESFAGETVTLQIGRKP